jgi:hypothetical protein
MDENLKKLKKMFLAEEVDSPENVFLLELRPNMNWKKDCFHQLVREMYQCCEKYESKETLEKWIAEGFWYLSTFVKDWTTHPNFPKQHSNDYYEKSYILLEELAFYFFTGGHPRIDKRNLIEEFLEKTQ